MRWRDVAMVAALAGGCADPEPGTIWTIAGTGEAGFTADGRDPTETQLYLPIQVLLDRDDRPLIVDWNNHRVRAITPDGLRTVLGTGLEGSSAPNVPATEFS